MFPMLTENEHYASIFLSGHSQAVRLPRAFRLRGKKVRIQKIGENLLLSPIQEKTWDDFFTSPARASSDFMDFDRSEAPQERDLF